MKEAYKIIIFMIEIPFTILFLFNITFIIYFRWNFYLILVTTVTLVSSPSLSISCPAPRPEGSDTR